MATAMPSLNKIINYTDRFIHITSDKGSKERFNCYSNKNHPLKCCFDFYFVCSGITIKCSVTDD